METVMYDGRIVPRDNFRTFIYGINSQPKLVNSWSEFQEHIATGLWFSSLGDVPVELPIESCKEVVTSKPKGRKKHGNS